MSRFIIDTETDGLLPALTKLNSLVLINIDTRETHSFADQPGYRPIRAGLEMAAEADMLVGHNVIKFDVPAIQKVSPWWKPSGIVRDTIVLSRLIWTDLRDRDFKLVKRKKLPANMTGLHKLEAWGHRLGEYKGDFKGPWDTWTKEMQDYCEQDCEVTLKLWLLIESKKYSEEAIELEHAVQWIVARQERWGIAFDVPAAQRLLVDLRARVLELEDELRVAFKPWFRKIEEFVPKRDNKAMGYVAGCAMTKVALTSFNPGSRDHIANRLITLRGWEPVDFGKDGKPTVDDEVLGVLPWPEAKLIAEYLMVDKRLGALADGKQAWLKNERNGRIHGSVSTNGAVTGRMTHMHPNLAQVPSNHAPWGKRCRELFTASTGFVLLGADASALELCDLAGYMAKFDGGAYIDTVLKGDKKLGTDMHSVNARALGMDPTKTYEVGGQSPTGRDIAKTWFYAFIYGAGDYKLGLILGIRGSHAKITAAGRTSRARFLKNLPALGKLTDLVKKKARAVGHLRGLDGRLLHIRSDHAALNTLLQGAGAAQMKKALVLLDQSLQAAGYVPGVDYEFVANVHDEWQLDVKETIAAEVGKLAVAAITAAGEHFKFPCPLSGDAKVGRNWSETH